MPVANRCTPVANSKRSPSRGPRSLSATLMQRVVTIDGPAGAGKSTVARQLAGRLGWRFLDTGAMYRAVTLAALRAGVDLTNDAALAAWSRQLEVQHRRRASLSGRRGRHGIDSQRSRSRNRRGSSPIARAFGGGFRPGSARLLQGEDVVTEGRDQGTLVFPDAFRKYYLTASDEERARRRLAEYAARQRADQLRGRAGRPARAGRPRRDPRDRPDETGRRRDRASTRLV